MRNTLTAEREEYENMEHLATVVIASFVGSLHCTVMCGPLVAFAVGNPTGERRASRVGLHAAYHGGRLSTYSLVGGSAGPLAQPSIMAGPGSAAIGLRRSWPAR